MEYFCNRKEYLVLLENNSVKRKVCLIIDSELYDLVRLCALVQKRNVSDLVEEILREWISRNKGILAKEIREKFLGNV